LDNEFDGVQAAFNSSTGHIHDGTSGEGAPITKIGPVQDVVVSISAMYPKTTNTVDLGTPSLKYKDLHLAGNSLLGGTLGVTGATTLSAALTYGGVTLNNAVTGTGNMVLSNSPTLVTPALGTPSSGTVTNLTGTASININGTVGATTPASAAVTTLAASGAVTLSGGTANGVAYLNGSKVLTTGSALVFDGTNLGIGATSLAARLTIFASNSDTVQTNARFAQFNAAGTDWATLDIQADVANNLVNLSSSGSSAGGFAFKSASTERMRLDSAGNLGLGVTPSAWVTPGWKAIDLSTYAAFYQESATGGAGMSANAYYNGTNWIYKNTNPATRFVSDSTSGGHKWFTAPSGTAGTAVTYTERMRIHNSGGVSIGNTTDPGVNNLSVTGTVSARTSGTDATPSFSATTTGGSYVTQYTRRGSPFTSTVSQTGSSYAATVSMNYTHNTTYSGLYTLGVLNEGAATAGSFNVNHIDSAGANIRNWTFQGSTGNFTSPGSVSGTAGIFSTTLGVTGRSTLTGGMQGTIQRGSYDSMSVYGSTCRYVLPGLTNADGVNCCCSICYCA